MAPPERGRAHPVTTHYSFNDLERMKGWVSLVDWPCSGRFIHIIGHPSAAGRAYYRVGLYKFAGHRLTDVLPLCHAINQLLTTFQTLLVPVAWVAGFIPRQHTREGSPVSVLTGLDVEQLRWCTQRRFRYVKPPPVAMGGCVVARAGKN